MSELNANIIDEFSVVSNDLLFHINLRKIEIFGCFGNIPFIGITIIVVGDFLQLPLVRGRHIYTKSALFMSPF